MKTKQVIVVRKFPNMRTGKYCSQVAHASMAFLTRSCISTNWGYRIEDAKHYDLGDGFSINAGEHFKEIRYWLDNCFKKIVVYVNSEEELCAIHQKAIDKGLISHIITDNGATEFNGVPTKTCVAIGPHEESKFEGVTDGLPLF